jgi:mono/diheme cytochrome c family protein
MKRGFTVHGSRFPVGALAILLLLAGCHADEKGVWFDFERMIDQPKYQPYGESAYFGDGRAMRLPPEGTVAHDAVVDRPAVTTGLVNGVPVATIPVPVTLPLLRLGRDRFGTFCAPCHGLAGDGESVVSRKMELRRPPPFHTPVMRALPAGRYFQVATEGYGLMPSYAAELTPMERWAVVAYIRALQLSQNVRVDSLPPAVGAEIRAELRRAGGGNGND